MPLPPLDEQLKSALAADMLHVVGVRMPGGAATATDAGETGGASSVAREVEAPVLSRSLTGREPTQLGGVPLKELTVEELECLVEAEVRPPDHHAQGRSL